MEDSLISIFENVANNSWLFKKNGRIFRSVLSSLKVRALYKLPLKSEASKVIFYKIIIKNGDFIMKMGTLLERQYVYFVLLWTCDKTTEVEIKKYWDFE